MAGFALKGVYPFGEASALVVDGVHQYTAFYKELASQLEKVWDGLILHTPWDTIFMAYSVIISAARSVYRSFC